jgi:predicted small metal-binding protein
LIECNVTSPEEDVMKLVRCRDHGFDCPFEVKGSEDQVLNSAGEHAHREHGLNVDESLVKLVKEKWHEVPAGEKR